MNMLKRYISDFTGIAIGLIGLGVVAGVVFGDVPFVGYIYDSFISTVGALGEAGAAVSYTHLTLPTTPYV